MSERVTSEQARDICNEPYPSDDRVPKLAADLLDARATIAAQAKVIEAAEAMRQHGELFYASVAEHAPAAFASQDDFDDAIHAYDAVRAGGRDE